ncbi:MAG: DUF2127 domain-containing protein [Gemmatimonadaceae bacterium]
MWSGALRTVAVFEAAKGALVLLVGFGLLALVHHDVGHFAERLVHHTHLNPASRYPHVFLDLANRLTDGRLMLLAAGAVAYTCVRFIESYGLWFERRWAEWFAALSAGVYMPFELVALFKRVSWLSVGSLLLNVAVLLFMVLSLLHARKE